MRSLTKHVALALGLLGTASWQTIQAQRHTSTGGAQLKAPHEYFAIAVVDSFPYRNADAVIIRRPELEPADVILIRRQKLTPLVVTDALEELRVVRAFRGDSAEAPGLFRVRQGKVTGLLRDEVGASAAAIVTRLKKGTPRNLEGVGLVSYVTNGMPRHVRRP